MYAEVNKLFKKKENFKIPNLHIDLSNIDLISKADIYICKIKFENNHYIIINSKYKLNLIAQHFANSNRKNLGTK